MRWGKDAILNETGFDASAICGFRKNLRLFL